MAVVDERSRTNRLFRTWPFFSQRRRKTVDRYGQQSYTDSDINLRRNDTSNLNTIFITNSSKSLEIDNYTNMDIRTTNFLAPVFNIQRLVMAEDNDEIGICPICCDPIYSLSQKHMSCCNTNLCSMCFITHISTGIKQGKGKIECPSCTEEINKNEILYYDELPIQLRERYQQNLAQALSEQYPNTYKLCPNCNWITIIDDKQQFKVTTNLFSSMIDRPAKIIECEHCQQSWCWRCYAPMHDGQSCKEFKKDRTRIDTWAKGKRLTDNQRNAQKCPKCAIYIEKIDGCNHMQCGKCNAKFCYECGKRMRLPAYIGHDAKYSIFGCRYKLFPHNRFLRYFIRGSIFTGLVLVTPIVLGIIVALIGIGIPIIIIVGCLGLPVFLCIECKKSSS
ncbi:unnamed protein product [Didymodactylos carnosus]|uniref:RBR-type E3 ubiquitin transferase n=1 Tax=Didymodactylos carnosus TaxID=1234261 RepID=A0A813SPB8_9BILA|nr:unnamed protein product [Didymodactylos carnosus]CAF0797331.1 unnamed protein product [Didymodactylos carnosus]CAF3556244.1 unnamed protein product [Didymodactylos carnosus]CAF3582087.1 unnamed protein product [Didymodactylos carnosus]